MAVPNTKPLPRLLWLLPTCCLGTPSWAAEPAPSTPAPRLEEVQVTATLLPRRSEDIAGTVTVINAAEIQRQIANDLNDLTRYQPGLGMDTAARGGNQGFAIRGIGGNRVLMVLDGVRSADMYAAGPSSYGKDMFEVDDLKAVEIIRGPSSVLYGADAMGGAVVLRSKDPADYLDANSNFQLGLRTAYASDNEQYKGGLTLASRHGAMDNLVQYTRREFAEREVKGSGMLNPQDGTSDNLLWKLMWQAGPSQRFGLTADYNNESIDTRLDNDLGNRVFSSTGLDTSKRLRLGLSHEWRLDATLLDTLTTRINLQTTDATQYSEQLRTSFAFVDPRNPASARGTQALRQSDFRFNQENRSIVMVAGKGLQLAGAAHALIYGLSLEHTDTERPRYRCDTETTGGQVSCAIPSFPFAAPEVFPNKTFPDTRTTRQALFLQDEITLADGRLTLIPGLRYTRYEMDPRPDALLNGSGDIADYGGFSVSAVEEHDTSFNLGAVYDPGAGLSVFAQYSEGFRPPNFDESNQAFVNLGHGYATIPNPALRAETSQGLEAGIRGNYDRLSFSLVAYDNHYRDFIDSLALGTVNGISLFQDTNVGKARIHGSEFSMTWLLHPQWSWHAALAWSRGEDRNSGAALNSVDPFTVVSGLRYQTTDGRFELEGVVTLAEAQTRVSAPDRVRSEAWQVLDLIGRYNLGKKASLRFGLFNLFDAEYAPWGNLKGLAATDTRNIANAYMPGTNLRAGLDYQF